MNKIQKGIVAVNDATGMFLQIYLTNPFGIECVSVSETWKLDEATVHSPFQFERLGAINSKLKSMGISYALKSVKLITTVEFDDESE